MLQQPEKGGWAAVRTWSSSQLRSESYSAASSAQPGSCLAIASAPIRPKQCHDSFKNVGLRPAIRCYSVGASPPGPVAWQFEVTGGSSAGGFQDVLFLKVADFGL